VSWKRPLFLFHRWAGIVLCLFFALWFLSGLFMMYVEFPQLTRPERVAGLPQLDWSSARLAPADAAARLTAADFTHAGTPSGNQRIEGLADIMPAIERVRMGMLLGRPTYFFYPDNGTQPRAVFADTGQILRELDASTATRIAEDFARRARGTQAHSQVVATWQDVVQTDQWTVSAALNPHRPLHRVAIEDAHGTELYVSSTTGEVVRDSHRLERTLNYFGAVTHWIYPTVLRRYPDAWEWIVDILSAVGTVLAISGLWIGVLRWRRKRAPGKPAVPYRGWMRWHYFAGIVFGVTTITWVLSGLLSMNPLNLNPPRSPSSDQRLVLSGRSLTLADFAVPSPATFGRETVDVELVHYDAQPLYVLTSRDGTSRLAPTSVETDSVRLPSVQTIVNRAGQFMPGVPLLRSGVLTRYDDYYYTRHPERGEKPLPVVRLEFDDPDRTWFHIDPALGQVIERSTRTNRVFRWLYNGLHSWDIRWLWERRPLWDIAVIAFSLGGLTLSVIGIVIGVKRLKRRSSGVVRLTHAARGVTPAESAAARARGAY
jgi:hypothetical protein